jgi:hypothetical protein
MSNTFATIIPAPTITPIIPKPIRNVCPFPDGSVSAVPGARDFVAVPTPALSAGSGEGKKNTANFARASRAAE